MSTSRDYIEFIADQISCAGVIRYRMMFGEYALYCDEKVVALVCGNRLYVKPTAAGMNHIGSPVQAPPYKGAKMYYLIEDRIDDREWLSELIRITASELPLPKPKGKNKKSGSR
jgi:TfoX/Sxy family transcriptional regulator of competence genes